MFKQKITPSSSRDSKKKKDTKFRCNRIETSTSQRLYHTMSSGTTPAFACHHCRRSFHSVDARRMHVTRDHVDVHLNRRHRLRWCTTCNIWVERDGTHSLTRLHTPHNQHRQLGISKQMQCLSQLKDETYVACDNECDISAIQETRHICDV